MTVVHLERLWPLGPGVAGLALQRGLGHDLDLSDAAAALAQGGAHAVGAGVAAADHDHVFVLGVDRAGGAVAGVEHGLGVGGEILHREMDAGGFAAGGGQVAAQGGTGGEHDGVVVLAELGGVVGHANVRVAHEFDALLFEQLHAAKNDLFFIQLHVGDAIHEQATRTVGALKHGDGVAGGIELGGGGKTGGAGADDGDLLAGALAGGGGDDPALFPALVDDRALDVLDRDGRVVDAEHAGAFAGSGADATGELGEVIGLMQALEGLLPAAAEDEVVELGDEVVDRAAGGHAADEFAGVAEGDAAIHAARDLVAEFLLLQVEVKLVPVADALERGPVGGDFAEIFEEAGRFAHGGWRSEF